MMQPLQPPIPPVSAQQQGDGLIDIFRLIHGVLRYKWGILGFALVVAAAVAFYVSTLTPVYRASASVVLEVQEANVVAVEDVYSMGYKNYDYFATQFELLRSRNVAERVVRRLGLHEKPAAGPVVTEQQRPWYQPDLTALLPAREKAPPPQLSPEEEREVRIRAIAAAIAAGLQVEPVEFSHITYLSYESPDPQEAAAIVNAVAEEFIASNLESRLEGTVQATGWLNERLATLEANLRRSEEALQDFRDREGLVNVEGVTGLGTDELSLLSRRLEDARRARIEAQNIRAEVDRLGDASVEEFMTVPAVLEHELIGALNRELSLAERRVAELGKRYGPLHPKMVAAQSDLQAANEELATEIRKVVSGIGREYEMARRNEAELLSSWNARKSEIQDFNRKEFQLQQLQREVDTNQKLYDIFLTRIRGISETGGFERPHARLVDRAVVPSYPVRPNKTRSVALALVIGIVLGCAVALLLDLLDNTVKSHEDVEEKLDAALLGTVPKMETDKAGNFNQFWDRPESQFAEAFRTIRTGVLLSNIDNPPKVIVVTSTVPGEGKSTTVLNLASAMGQMEKTLVIGADMRRPSLAKKCGLKPNHLGLSHFVSGSAELEPCIEYMEALKVYVMPAGVIPPNPLEMISSRRFTSALKELRERFERIIIDSAPVQAVSDALVLASYADSVIYVVRADSTVATQVNKGIQSLIASNDPLTGVVLNHFDGSKAGKYYYGRKYYQYDAYYRTDQYQ
jgi:capsular exopolysaccharide synthesis family protein